MNGTCCGRALVLDEISQTHYCYVCNVQYPDYFPEDEEDEDFNIGGSYSIKNSTGGRKINIHHGSTKTDSKKQIELQKTFKNKVDETNLAFKGNNQLIVDAVEYYIRMQKIDGHIKKAENAEDLISAAFYLSAYKNGNPVDINEISTEFGNSVIGFGSAFDRVRKVTEEDGEDINMINKPAYQRNLSLLGVLSHKKDIMKIYDTVLKLAILPTRKENSKFVGVVYYYCMKNNIDFKFDKIKNVVKKPTIISIYKDLVASEHLLSDQIKVKYQKDKLVWSNKFIYNLLLNYEGDLVVDFRPSKIFKTVKSKTIKPVINYSELGSARDNFKNGKISVEEFAEQILDICCDPYFRPHLKCYDKIKKEVNSIRNLVKLIPLTCKAVYQEDKLVSYDHVYYSDGENMVSNICPKGYKQVHPMEHIYVDKKNRELRTISHFKEDKIGSFIYKESIIASQYDDFYKYTWNDITILIDRVDSSFGKYVKKDEKKKPGRPLKKKKKVLSDNKKTGDRLIGDVEVYLDIGFTVSFYFKTKKICVKSFINQQDMQDSVIDYISEKFNIKNIKYSGRSFVKDMYNFDKEVEMTRSKYMKICYGLNVKSNEIKKYKLVCDFVEVCKKLKKGKFNFDAPHNNSNNISIRTSGTKTIQSLKGSITLPSNYIVEEKYKCDSPYVSEFGSKIKVYTKNKKFVIGGDDAEIFNVGDDYFDISYSGTICTVYSEDIKIVDNRDSTLIKIFKSSFGDFQKKNSKMTQEEKSSIQNIMESSLIWVPVK